MQQLLDQLVTGYFDHIVADTRKLISYPSVYAQSDDPSCPFGAAINDALEEVISMARGMGFKAENYDGYMGVVDYGEGGDMVGMIAHIDVVPATGEWLADPFGGAILDGKLYGRGSLDDKGPLVAALYAMKAIKESALPLSNRLRFLIGTDEESGFRCIRHYLQKEKGPDYGFSPDGEFPVIYGEKGIYRFAVEGDWPEPPGGGLRVSSFAGGDRVNVIAEKACAALTGNPAELEQAETVLRSCAEAADLGIERRGNQLLLTATGLAAHSSLPWFGKNAINILLRALHALPLPQVGPHAYLNALHDLFADGHSGKWMGVANAGDEEFSPLTLSIGVLTGKKGHGRAIVDLRYPNLHDHDKLREKFLARCAEHGLKASVTQDKPGLYIPRDNRLVSKLLQAYREVSGRREEPKTIGGGTYCRALRNFVAFGPLFPGEREIAHEKNEYISLENLLLCSRIYTQALYSLLK